MSAVLVPRCHGLLPPSRWWRSSRSLLANASRALIQRWLRLLTSPRRPRKAERYGRLNADQRYDLGRIAAVAGDEQIAKVQSDSILASQPQHLLGLLLAADAARLRGDRSAEAAYLRRFAAAAPSERPKQLPEYAQHASEIDARLAQSRSR